MVALDSNIFIYWLERNPEFFEASNALLKKIHEGKLTGHCSNLVYAEVFYGDTAVFNAINSIKNLVFYPMDTKTAQLAGQLRYAHNIKGLDAIHLASAMVTGATRFITNDKALTKLRIEGLEIQLL